MQQTQLLMRYVEKWKIIPRHMKRTGCQSLSIVDIVQDILLNKIYPDLEGINVGVKFMVIYVDNIFAVI